MVALQKRGFLNNTRKISKPLFSTGGHTGPPLQRHEKPLNRDVWEHGSMISLSRCMYPKKMVETIILEMILKTSFLQCNQIIT